MQSEGARQGRGGAQQELPQGRGGASVGVRGGGRVSEGVTVAGESGDEGEGDK